MRHRTNANITAAAGGRCTNCGHELCDGSRRFGGGQVIARLRARGRVLQCHAPADSRVFGHFLFVKHNCLWRQAERATSKPWLLNSGSTQGTAKQRQQRQQKASSSSAALCAPTSTWCLHFSEEKVGEMCGCVVIFTH